VRFNFIPPFLILFIVACCPKTGHGQVTYEAFIQEQKIEQKVTMGLELWNEYMRGDMDSLKVTAVELLLFSIEKKSDFGTAVGRRILGSYLIRSGQIDHGLECLIQGKNYFEKKEDATITSEIYNEMGHALLLKGEFKEAIKAYQTSVKFGKQSTDKTAVYNGKLGMGKAYVAIGDTNVGITLIQHYKDRAIQDSKYEAASDAFAYLGMVEHDRGNLELGNEYYLKSQGYSKKSSSAIHLSHSYTNLAIVKFNQDDQDSALIYFNKSLELRVLLNNKKAIVEGLYNLGSFYDGIADSTLAILHFEKSRAFSAKNGMIVDQVDALIELIRLSEKTASLQRLNKLQKEKDSLSGILETQSGISDDILEFIELSSVVSKGEELVRKSDSMLSVETIIITVTLLLFVFFAFFKPGEAS